MNTTTLRMLRQNGDIGAFSTLTTLAQWHDTIYTPYLPDPEESSEAMLTNGIDPWEKVKTTSGIKIVAMPVPADKTITINVIADNVADYLLNIYDVSGKVVYTQKYKQTNNIVSEVNTEQFAIGNYIAKIAAKETNQSEELKFSVAH